MRSLPRASDAVTQLRNLTFQQRDCFTHVQAVQVDQLRLTRRVVAIYKTVRVSLPEDRLPGLTVGSFHLLVVPLALSTQLLRQSFVASEIRLSRLLNQS